MDTLTQVRELRQTGPSDLGAARAALDTAINSSPRRNTRPRTRGLLIGAATLAVGGIVTASTIGLLGGPGSPAGPASASAQEILANAATLQISNYDFPLNAGQFLHTTVTTQRLVYLNPQDPADPFTAMADGATGAVITEDTRNVYTPASGDEYTIQDIGFHGTTSYGDLTAVQTGWKNYYEANGVPAIGAAPDATAYRSADWMVTQASGTDLNALDKNRPGADTLRTQLGQPTIEDQWRSLADPRVIYGTGEYRATLLNALSQTDGVTVDHNDNGIANLTYTGTWATYKVTIDTAKGLIQKVQITDAKLATTDTTGKSTTVSQTRPSFVPADTADLTVTITQDVVDAAPPAETATN
ncbi:hypothetical protein [Microbacterium azadirachtae]|uniref:Uncharacterized protein n=1 Tax=Microbacterium azadirachtae TaxID=582680 RepID=A0A1I6G8E1_9MICO|nr:hypothetical protein [Microbacterium azadirachtae]SDL37481.1 hypothetical protein SAMN04488593_0878 [Microbacterium azadirachtae]SEF68388.1 hypothetical protein SAMN04488594_0868 [Microbacterium azadirachtae]SEF69069.1 hypothetical protein SAMN04488592_0877 [Microbacterium azadirachtae]SFR38466.1 hypothetical protein SAMN04488591_0874 [Microbacterium azadirachtae]